jgi:hypothetical protein
MSKPIKLSRSSLELFLECPRCFHLKIKHRISRPNTAHYSLNLEVDNLLKKEFDIYRQEQRQHPIQKKYNLPFIPALNKNLDQWRHNFTGVQHLDTQHNFLLYGSLDDLWVNPTNQVHTVVDYKATCSQYSPSKTRLEQYSRQLSFYNWLLQKNNLQTHDQNYILLYNCHNPENESFNQKLQFKPSLIPIKQDNSWIESTLKDIKNNLNLSELPLVSKECKHCQFYQNQKQLSEIASLPF